MSLVVLHSAILRYFLHRSPVLELQLEQIRRDLAMQLTSVHSSVQHQPRCSAPSAQLFDRPPLSYHPPTVRYPTS